MRIRTKVLAPECRRWEKSFFHCKSMFLSFLSGACMLILGRMGYVCRVSVKALDVLTEGQHALECVYSIDRP